MTELTPVIVEAFHREEIGVGHALLLAKLQPAQQEQALPNCFREDWGGDSGKAKRILLPIRHLQHWIEHNVLLLLKQAPFNKRDAQLVPAAGSCVDCPKRTGNNKLLFAEWASDNESQCTDPNCYAAKVEAFLQKQIATKPELVQISTAYGQQQEGSKIITRSKYVEIKSEKPDTPEKAKWPEFNTCKYITEAIVSEGMKRENCARFAPKWIARFITRRSKAPRLIPASKRSRTNVAEERHWRTPPECASCKPSSPPFQFD